MKLDYYGFYIGKIYYEYKKKFRIVEIDISGEIHYALQKNWYLAGNQYVIICEKIGQLMI